jgi:hypothetical protein
VLTRFGLVQAGRRSITRERKSGAEARSGIGWLHSARRAARVPCWLKSSRTDPSGVRSQRRRKCLAGRRCAERRKGGKGWQSQRRPCAGQGAHREVGSEGFAANRRAVADEGDPVGQIQRQPSLHYGGEGNTWGAGHNKVCAGGTAGKEHALPREVSYGLARRGGYLGV